MSHPVDWVNGVYRIFDGGYGLGSPVGIERGTDGKLHAHLTFGGSVNAVQGDFTPNLNEWTHIAAVWDRGGIDGTEDKVRLYVNGDEIGAIQSSSWGTSFNNNHADIAGGNDFMANRFALDNLVIYNYAKTDFSDRFNENPLPVLSCVGFEHPLINGLPVTVKKNRALPFKAKLNDSNGMPVTNAMISNPPIIQIRYQPSAGGPTIDVSDEALPVGLGTTGNQFVFIEDKWQFNLKTTNYTATGIYEVNIVSGDGYVISPTCSAQFVIQ